MSNSYDFLPNLELSTDTKGITTQNYSFLAMTLQHQLNKEDGLPAEVERKLLARDADKTQSSLNCLICIFGMNMHV